MKAKSDPKTLLFLCTGNYYRSRFAEVMFNSVAAKMQLPWLATSRGLALERGVNNLGPMAKSALETLQSRGIQGGEALMRFPIQVVADDFEKAHWIVALQEAEHSPLLTERFPLWSDKVEFWHVEDALGVLPLIEREVMDLSARLILGGKARPAGPLKIVADLCGKCGQPLNDCKCQAKSKNALKPAVIRIGRETKGRRGAGVTIIFDLPLKDEDLKKLAATLKSKCGTGGTVKDGCIEIQGDQRDRLTVELESLGYKVKRAGG